jgi:hypothetical protein
VCLPRCAGSGGRLWVLASRRSDDRLPARLADDRVRHDAEGARAEASAEGRSQAALAVIRPEGAADAHLDGLQAPAAVPAPLDVQCATRARVSAVDRVRPPLPRPAARAVLRRAPPDREEDLGAPLQPLLGVVADGRVPGRLPRLDAAAPVQPLPAQPAGNDHGDGGADGEADLDVPRRRLRDLAARHRQDALRRLVGSQALRDQHLHRQAPLDVHGRPRDQQLAGLREREGVLRDRRRQPLRDQRAHRTARLAGARAVPVRTARVLLRDPDDRLRPRLHREHGWDAVRVRRLQRADALGAAGRHLHLHRRRRLAPPRLCRHLRRLLHGVQRRHRRPDLAVRRFLGDPRGAERRERDRLLRRVPALRERRVPVREAGRPRHLRAERADRQARVALARRRLQPGRRRQQPPVRRRPLPRLQLRAEASACRSEAASTKATSSALKGQIRYEFWKTRER